MNPDCIDAGFVLGTSCVVERFFSMCKLTLQDKRASLTPWMFECIVFLQANKELWGMADTVVAAKMAEGENIDPREAADYEANKELLDGLEAADDMEEVD